VTLKSLFWRNPFAAPLILFEMWLFIAPGLYKNEGGSAPHSRSFLFFFAEGFYSVLRVFPYAFKYLLGFESILSSSPS